MRFAQVTLIFMLMFLTSGCLITKVVTVPMRVGGAVISVIPICGDSIDAAIDEAADIIDDVPL
ncbi:MAG TPA: hypothetical protein ENN66_02740 [Proteobacteria bacterium]|nr:hypothetical protein [Pseudomonadota bacterium]